MTTKTTGIWEVNNGRINAGSQTIADNVWNLADARLMAAAPELLVALKSLVPALEGRGFSPTEVEISNVLNAIAKAERGSGSNNQLTDSDRAFLMEQSRQLTRTLK